MTRPRVRDDLQALEGYHSPQVSVAVRLNTNESPEPPPPAWRDALAAEISRLDWHRYPDRSARELREAIGAFHGVPAAQVFAANGSNEVLQTLLLAYAGPGRHVVTFEPTYQLHGHIARLTGALVAEGERGPDFTLDASEACRVIDALRPSVTFLCSPNNPTGLVEPEATVRSVLDGVDRASGLLVVDEAYGQFAPWSALGLVDEQRPLVVTRTFSKTWSMAAARLGLPDRAELVGGRARQCRAAVPPRRGQAGRRTPGPALRGRDGNEGEARGGRAGTDRRRARDAPRRGVAVGRQLRPVPADGAETAGWSGKGCWTDPSSFGTARAGPASTGACG